MTKPITDRIQAALKGGKSEGVSALIEEVNAAAMQSREASKAARGRALDPLLTDKQIEEARKDSEDALFFADRMDRAAQALNEALKTFLADEEQDRRRDRYAAVKARRDEIEAKFHKRYPTLADELGALLAEITEAENEINAVNAKLPDGGQHLMQIQQQDRRHTTIIRLPNVSASRPMVWGPSDQIGEPQRFRPHADVGRLVPRDAGEVA